VRTTGAMGKANPFRFSTKYQDDESDLLYYGYRYYKPSMGTWLSKDPVNERGFQVAVRLPGRFLRHEEENLYCFLRGQSINRIDKLGLAEGTYSINNTTMKLNGDDHDKRGPESPNPVKAFSVTYNPNKPCSCKRKDIVLVQAVKHDYRLFVNDYEPRFDYDLENPPSGSLPPPYAGRTSGNLEYLDSPYYEGRLSLTWSFEVCALCRNGITPEVNLGCHTFTWHNQTVDAEGDFDATDPGDLWNAAMAAWTKLHPDNPDK